MYGFFFTLSHTYNQIYFTEFTKIRRTKVSSVRQRKRLQIDGMYSSVKLDFKIGIQRLKVEMCA
jgi:hypothetical protein